MCTYWVPVVHMINYTYRTLNFPNISANHDGSKRFFSWTRPCMTTTNRLMCQCSVAITHVLSANSQPIPCMPIVRTGLSLNIALFMPCVLSLRLSPAHFSDHEYSCPHCSAQTVRLWHVGAAANGINKMTVNSGINGCGELHIAASLCRRRFRVMLPGCTQWCTIAWTR